MHVFVPCFIKGVHLPFILKAELYAATFDLCSNGYKGHPCLLLDCTLP